MQTIHPRQGKFTTFEPTNEQPTNNETTSHHHTGSHCRNNQLHRRHTQQGSEQRRQTTHTGRHHCKQSAAKPGTMGRRSRHRYLYHRTTDRVSQEPHPTARADKPPSLHSTVLPVPWLQPLGTAFVSSPAFSMGQPSFASTCPITTLGTSSFRYLGAAATALSSYRSGTLPVNLATSPQP